MREIFPPKIQKLFPPQTMTKISRVLSDRIQIKGQCARFSFRIALFKSSTALGPVTPSLTFKLRTGTYVLVLKNCRFLLLCLYATRTNTRTHNVCYPIRTRVLSLHRCLQYSYCKAHFNTSFRASVVHYQQHAKETGSR